MRIVDIFEDFDDEDEDDYGEEDMEEIERDEAISELLYRIRNECQYYMEANPSHKDNPLFRGKDIEYGEYGDYWMEEESPYDRKPAMMPASMNAILDEGMRLAGMDAIRSNSIFCTNSEKQAHNYGEICVVYPIGNVHVSYSEDIVDAYTQRRKILTNIIYPSISNKEELPDFEEINDATYSHHGDGAEIDAILKKAKIDKRELAQRCKAVFRNDGIVNAIDKSDGEILINGDVILINAHFFRDYIRDQL